jgi:hypothetical protein
MNACSIKGTPYEEEYRQFMSEGRMIFAWNKNNEQPLDKIKVGNEVVENPLYTELMAHPITQGNRTEALKIIAETFQSDFTSKYTPGDSGQFSLVQVIDYLQQKQKRIEDALAQKIQSVNVTTSKSINFYEAQINGTPTEIHFSDAEGQEIFETFEYMLGEYGSWAEVQQQLLGHKNNIISKIDPNNATSIDIKQLKALVEISENFELFRDWYENQEGVVGIEELEAELGESQDWKTKEKSQKERASKRILALVTSLPSYRKASVGEYNFAEERPYKSDEKVIIQGTLLGLPKSGDFQKNWNLLSTALSGITDYTKQYDEIAILAKTHPQFNNLLKKIPNPRVANSTKTIKQIMFAMGLKRIFSNPETIAVSLDVSKKGNSVFVTQQIKGFRNIKNLFNQLDKNYFAYNKDYAMVGDTGTEFNVDKFVSDFSNLFSNKVAIAALSTKDLKAKKELIRDLFTGANKSYYINEFTKLLNALGVGLSNKEYLLPSNIGTTTEMYTEYFASFSNIFAKLRLTAQINSELVKNNRPTISIKGPLAYIANADAAVFPDGKNPSEDVKAAAQQLVSDRKTPFKIEGVFGFLQKKQSELTRLVEYISSYDIELRPSSYLTAEDKKKFIRGPWFYLTQNTKAVNEASNYEELITTPGFERFDYRKNPDILGSVWLTRLFGLPKTVREIQSRPLNSYKKQEKFGLPVNLEIRDFNGIEFKNMGEKVGKTTTNLHPGDKVMQDFMSFFQSTEMENIRFGDKSSSFSIYFSNPVLGEKIYVPISTSRLEGKPDGDAEISAKQQFLDTMTGYLQSEFTRVLDLISNPQSANTTYQKYGKNLFIFGEILPDIADKVKNAETTEQLVSLYELAVQSLPAALDNYFKKEANNLVRTMVKTMSLPIDRQSRPTDERTRLLSTVASLNKLKFVNSQLLPKGYDLKVTADNLQYLAELYIKNGFINNVEFMKFFVGDLANFNKTDKDAREVFKRIPFTSSPGTPPYWDSALQEFFKEDANQDSLSRIYTGTAHAFSPIVRTVVYNDVLTFEADEFEKYKEVYNSGLWDSLSENERYEYDAYVNKSDEEANAQGVVTLDFYRNYLISIEGWSDAQEKSFNDQVRIAQITQDLKNNPANAQELIEERRALIEKTGNIPFPPLKLGHYGPIVEDPKLNALHKYSLVPLVPSVIIGKQLEKQLELMYQNRVDYYTFKSGSKMANYGEMLDFYKVAEGADGNQMKVMNDALSDRNVTSIHLHNLRQQQYQAPKFKGESTLSTQMMKLVFGDFYEFGELSTDFTEPTKQYVSSLYDRFKTSLNDLVKFEQVRLERKLGVTRNAEGKIENINQLQLANYLAKEFEKKEVSESLRKYIQVDDKGNFKYPLDAINDRSQIESMLLNLINSKVISQKIFGESYIQIAGSGFEASRFAKPTKEQLEKYGANDLQFYRVDPVTGETLPMEVRVGFNPEKHSGLLKLMYKEKPVGTLENLNEILKSDNPLALKFKEKYKEQLTMVGVRIPVQGFQSMEHVIVKEFLPESAGAIMILPAQIVVKSGGDYDIDKLTFFETAYDESGNVIDKAFDLKDYESKLTEQRELKKEKQRLLGILKVIKDEMNENEAYAQREDLKKELKKLDAEVKKSLKNLNGLLNREEFTKEDKEKGLDELSESKYALMKVVADLRTFDGKNDTKALNVMSALRKDLAEVNKKINQVDDYKKGITNNLVQTLKEVLSIGELYDHLVVPNNNNILTQYTGKSRPISTTQVFNPMTSWRIYAENILSKDALGIDAKINTMQKEFQRANLKFNSKLLNAYYFPSNKDAEGNIQLGGKKDQAGNRISKILSEFINGHVDIAKEDWIILLGMNQETSPLAHAMILSGTPVKTVIDFIKSKPIQLVLELSNRPVINQKLDKAYFSKNSAIVSLIKSIAYEITDPDISKELQLIAKNQTDNQVKGKKALGQYIETLLSNPKINKHLTNFNPEVTLLPEERALRDLAYYLQFGVVVAQQESLRELTSLADFNTANYRTTFQSVELLDKQSTLKSAFNGEAIDFMFKDSALAQFNVGSFTLDLMSEAFPLSDSKEVHTQLNKMLEFSELVSEEERREAITQYKNNLLYTHVAMNAKNENGSLLEYYRGKDGLFVKNIENNMAQRFEKLASNPDLRGNFLFNNLYIEDDNILDREFSFHLRNIESVEYGKQYREAFLEGLNHADVEVRSFFKDLALGSFMQNGAHYRSRDVSSVVPFEAYVEYTAGAYNELIDMKDNNPGLFSKYLSLVGFATVLSRANGSKPLIALPSHLSQYHKEAIDAFYQLTPELVEKVTALENAVLGKEVSPVTKLEGQMTYSYGNEKRPDVIAATTFDAILSGERTATTRFEKDGKLDYWKSAKVGDIITWKSGDGRTVDVEVTKALHPLVGSGKTPEIWSKLEGWSIGRFNTKVKPLINQAYQIEFKLAKSIDATNANSLNQDMFGPAEIPTDVMPPQNPTLPTTDKGPVNLKNKLNPGQPGNDEGNLDGLGFEEVSCDV